VGFGCEHHMQRKGREKEGFEAKSGVTPSLVTAGGPYEQDPEKGGVDGHITQKRDNNEREKEKQRTHDVAMDTSSETERRQIQE